MIYLHRGRVATNVQYVVVSEIPSDCGIEVGRVRIRDFAERRIPLEDHERGVTRPHEGLGHDLRVQA